MELKDARKFLAEEAKHSSDLDTKVGCVITKGTLFIGGSNRLPRGLAEKPERLNRPGKYAWIMHAERYAIAQAARCGLDVGGGTMFLDWFPCSDCAQMIIQSGISQLYGDRKKFEERMADPKYGFRQSYDMLTEAGVRIDWLPEE